MRSIYAKILAWSFGSFLIALIALASVHFSIEFSRPGPFYFLQRTLAMIGDDVCEACKNGDSPSLARYLKRLDEYYGSEHFVIDSTGRDLVQRMDRSQLIEGLVASDGPPHPVGDRMVVLRQLPDPRFRLLILLPYTVDAPSVLPYFGFIIVVIATLGYILAVHLVAPLRSLRHVVDRFGRGDLKARARSTRKDEIGELSRAFDDMANQIETLRTAEVRLLQDVSHELRSPLARIGFNLELARLGGDRETTYNRLEKDFGRLKTLVEELLQLTRAEGDPTARGLLPLSVDTLIASVIDDCAQEAEIKGCLIVSRLNEDVTILGDPELLRRALENVLRNAIRHSPENSLIETALRVEDGKAIITMRDFGTGVPEHALELIFEPFFRIGDDRSRASGGVGLGLAIARRAVVIHQGRVTAQNAYPGLRITIELPSALSEVVASLSECAHAESSP